MCVNAMFSNHRHTLSPINMIKQTHTDPALLAYNWDIITYTTIIIAVMTDSKSYRYSNQNRRRATSVFNKPNMGCFIFIDIFFFTSGIREALLTFKGQRYYRM